MYRRHFLRAAVAAPLAVPLLSLATPGTARAAPAMAAAPGQWRSFELTQNVEIARARGAVKLWLPLPQTSPYQRLDALNWTGSADLLGVYRDPARSEERRVGKECRL